MSVFEKLRKRIQHQRERNALHATAQEQFVQELLNAPLVAAAEKPQPMVRDKQMTERTEVREIEEFRKALRELQERVGKIMATIDGLAADVTAAQVAASALEAAFAATQGVTQLSAADQATLDSTDAAVQTLTAGLTAATPAPAAAPAEPAPAEPAPAA